MRNFKQIVVSFLFLTFLTSCHTEITPSFNSSEIDFRQSVLTNNPGYERCSGEPFTIFLGDCIEGTDIEEAFLSAIEKYSQVPDVALEFEIVEDEEGSDISAFCGDSEGCCLLGNSGNPNDSGQVPIQIDDVNHDCCGELNLCQLTSLVMHELGHALGLGHTGDHGGNSDYLHGTPKKDEDSVMNAGTDSVCEGICDFSEGDIKALQLLYPCDCGPNTISGPSFLCVTGEEATLCYEGSYESVTWNIPSGYELTNESGNCITVIVKELQLTSSISLTVQDMNCEYLVEKEINTFQAPNFSINHSSSVCLGDVVEISIQKIPEYQDLKAIDWSISGGNQILSQTQNKLIYQANEPGTVEICVTVINECGVEKERCVQFNIITGENCSPKDGPFNPK